MIPTQLPDATQCRPNLPSESLWGGFGHSICAANIRLFKKIEQIQTSKAKIGAKGGRPESADSS